MRHKTFELIEVKAEGEAGEFSALASVFGNVDLVGDRMMPGSFAKTLERWRKSGDPIPVVLSHDWDDPMKYVGEADPRAVLETKDGLLVQGKLDIGAGNPVADQVYKLMKKRLLKGWSFGYTVPEDGQKLAEGGVNEVSEVDLIEVGPTLKGANPEAQLQAVKSIARAADDPALEEKLLEPETEEKAVTPAALRALADALESDNPPSDQEVMRRMQGMMGSSYEPDTSSADTSAKSQAIDATPEDPGRDKARALDPLRKRSRELALESLSGGPPTRTPPSRTPAPEPPPSWEEQLRHSREQMLDVLRG